MLSAKLQGVINNIKKTQGDEVYIDLKDASRAYPKLCSWGSINMDIASGGGVPKGRIVEIMGWESSGKSTIMLEAMAQAQKEGHVVAYIDTEHAFDVTYGEAIGLDVSPDRFLFFQPDTAEETLNIIEILGESGEVGLIVNDSVAAMVPRIELEGESGDLKVGLLARLMSQHLRKSVALSKKGVTVMYVNQYREKIGVMYGDNKTTPGGNSLKYFTSQRLEVARIGREGEAEAYTGNETKVTFKKNKLAPPFKVAYFTIIYGQGISTESEIIDACLSESLGLLVKTGAGVCLNYPSVFYGEGAIDTTEAKTAVALQTPMFENVFFELKIALDQKLGVETPQEVLDDLAERQEKAREDALLFDEYNKQQIVLSGKSKHVECKYFCDLALAIRPYDKAVKKKSDQMYLKIKERLGKGDETLKGDLLLEDGIILNLIVEKGEFTIIKKSEVVEEETQA